MYFDHIHILVLPRSTPTIYAPNFVPLLTLSNLLNTTIFVQYHLGIGPTLEHG